MGIIALITPNLRKYLQNVQIYKSSKKIVCNYITNNAYYHIRYDNGDEFICIEPDQLKFYNMQITKLILDRNIDEDFIKTKIMPKYIGRKEDIVWI